MKKEPIISLLLLFSFTLINGYATAQNKTEYTILMTGASFASADNGWFEMGCQELKATPINRAVGGEAIANSANKMLDGSLYSFEELDRVDALIIMHVHNKDVFDEAQILPQFTDYPVPFDRSNYAAAFDYTIKRYISECYELKDNPQSKYYGTKSGKPAVIVLCTDWHDARTTYNTSIRKLADKWSLPLVEFDKRIGFSKESPHPVTNKQQSLLYSPDTQTIDGVEYGWHPERGYDKYVQRRMASIFVEVMKKVLPLK